MARNNARDRSYDDSRLPAGMLVVATLVVVLAVGIYLIVSGLA